MMAADDPRHGQPAGHNGGCRCVPCCAAKIRYDKRRRYEFLSTGQRRVVPSYRAVRRIHALQALGYSVRMIAEEAGLCTKTLYDVSLERSASTWRSHFEPLAAAYDRLAAHVPEGPYIARNRRYAEAKGWAPPLAWDDIDDIDEVPTISLPTSRGHIDEVVVQRILNGDTTAASTTAERREVVRRWRNAGRPLRQLELSMGWKTDRYYDPSDGQVAS